MQPETSFAVNAIVEGITDEAVVRRILAHVGLPCGTVFVQKGKGELLKKLPKYNEAAKHFPWFAVVDLDQKPDCAPDLIENVLPKPSAGMRFRVAVHAVEAWLLADSQNLSAYLHVSETKFPEHPDSQPNPKVTLVQLAQQSSRREIREDMIPRPGSGSSVGPAYTGRLIEFVTMAQSRWRPEAAIERSDSLRRCITALQTLKNWK